MVFNLEGNSVAQHAENNFKTYLSIIQNKNRKFVLQN